MSSASGAPRSRSVRAPEPRTRFSVVPRTPHHRPRAPFIVLVVALMSVGLIGLLVINTTMQRKAFELTSLQERAATLQTREQALQLEVDRLSSPDRIASEAGELGMVPSSSSAFVRLGNGDVVGNPRTAMPGTNLPQFAPPPASGSEREESARRAESNSDRGAQNNAGENNRDRGDASRNDRGQNQRERAGDRNQGGQNGENDRRADSRGGNNRDQNRGQNRGQNRATDRRNARGGGERR